MAMLFGRPCSNSLYVKALEELSESGDPAERALALNLMHDGRVSKEREDLLDVFVQKARRPNPGLENSPSVALRDGIKKYFQDRVRECQTPDFVVREFNATNIDKGTEAVADAARQAGKAGLFLVHLLNLNGLVKLYSWANGAGAEYLEPNRFRLFPGKPDEDAVREWLNLHLDGVSDEDRSSFVKDVCELMRTHREVEKKYFHPYWAAAWHEMEAHLNGGADRWSQVLGLDHNGLDGQWVVLLVYAADEETVYARPTQLEAGVYPFHFPSPADAPCGHPMHLRADEPGGQEEPPLMMELVHREIDHTEGHFIASKCAIGRTSVRTDKTRLFDQRSWHDRLLSRRYPKEDAPP